MNEKRLKKMILFLSITLYVFSLTQESFYIDGQNPKSWSNSFVLLISGWIGAIIGGKCALIWIANPLIFFSWFCFLNKKINYSFLTSLLAFLFCNMFLFCDEIITSVAPNYSKIIDLKSGYWIWNFSISMVFISNLIFIMNKKLRDNE